MEGHVLTNDFLRAKFDKALPYERYIQTGKPDQLEVWKRFERLARDHASLDSHQRSMLRDFTRRINILALSGMWCGDCNQQCPLLAIIADEAPELIDLRFLDRDQNLDLAEPLKICGGLRVPTVVFMNEDFDFVSVMGDKSLSRLQARSEERRVGKECRCRRGPTCQRQ